MQWAFSPERMNTASARPSRHSCVDGLDTPPPPIYDGFRMEDRDIMQSIKVSLRRIALYLVAANVALASHTYGALEIVWAGDPASIEATFVGCGGLPEARSLPSKEELYRLIRSQQLGLPGPDIPICPEGNPNCTKQKWVWEYCLKEGTNPLICHKWIHYYYRWFCPGANYHNCDGFSWEDTNENCTPCGNTTLPQGCNPPIPNSTYCSMT